MIYSKGLKLRSHWTSFVSVASALCLSILVPHSHFKESSATFSGCSSLQATSVRFAQSVSIRLNMDESLNLMVLSDERSWTVMNDDYKSKDLVFEPPASYRFVLRDLTGRFWDASGRATTTKVFEKSGEYSLYFAENLETESDNTLHCLILIEVVNVGLP